MIRVAVAQRVFALALWWSASAWAAPCSASAELAALEGVQVETRIDFISRSLDANASRLRIWSRLWGSTYAVATVAQGVALPLVRDSGTRVDLVAGGIAAGIGTVSLYLLPLRIIWPAARVRESLGGTDRCQVLADAEAEFFAAAEVDRLSGSLIGHAGNVAVNTALALVLGLGYGRWKTAAISAGVGVVVGELNLLTQPHGLVDAEQRYRSGQLGSADAKASWWLVPVLEKSFAGVALVGTL